MSTALNFSFTKIIPLFVKSKDKDIKTSKSIKALFVKSKDKDTKNLISEFVLGQGQNL